MSKPKTLLEDLVLHEVSLVDRGANPGAHVLLLKRDNSLDVNKTTKTEDGKDFQAGDYAYTPDKESPSTWKLRLTNTPGGEPDAQIVGAAVAALGEGFRGNRVEIPSGDRAGVIARVRAAWVKANPEKDREQLPPVLKDGGTLMEKQTVLEKAKQLLKSFTFTKEEKDQIFKEDDVDQLEKLTAQVAKLEADNALANTITKYAGQISKIKTLEALETLAQEIGKLEAKGDARVALLTEQMESRKAELEATTKSEKFSEFAKALPKPMQGAFDNMTPEEKKQFMDSYGKSGNPVDKAMTDLVEKNAKLEAEVSKLSAETEIKKLVEGDLAVLKNVMKVDEVATAVIALRKVDKKNTDVLVDQVKALVAQVKEGNLFKAVGSDLGGEADAEKKLEQLAKDYFEAHKSEAGMTKEAAYAIILDQNKELYTKSLEKK